MTTKYCLSTVLFFFSVSLFSQIPSHYYQSAENLSDENLKYQLNQIIDNHVEFPYTSYNTDVWDILKETDKDPNNPDNVIVIYSGASINAVQEYNEAAGWTREHIWAKSRGNFGTTLGAGTDVHALRPLDVSSNSIRNNRSFNNCNSCEDVKDSWNNITGSKIDTINWSFEPRDEVKGDIARMMFYMVVRYEGDFNDPDLEPTEILLDQNDNSPISGIWSTLIDWHRNDPVDAWEENRNDIIYYSYQNNRNPFIDYPELAEYLWGNRVGNSWSLETLSVATANETEYNVYPNPASDYINIKGIKQTTNVTVFDALGRQVLISQIDKYNNRINVSHLKGIYVMTITNQNSKTSKKLVVR